MSTTSSSVGSGSLPAFSPTAAARDYDLPPPPPPPTSSFFFFPTADYVEEPPAAEQEESNSLPPPPIPYNYYAPVFASRANRSETCACNSPTTHVPSYDISSSFQTPFVYEQYLTTLKSEQSDHLPYLFDNIIYPQPCSPPSPTNDSITYYQLDQANTTAIINKLPQRSHMQIIQPIIYHQLSLVEPPSSNIQQKLPIVKRFYYDSNLSNTTTTTIMTTTSIVANTIDHDQVQLPYARLESTYFGTYDVWQKKTLVGRKNNRRDVDVNIGSTSMVSRVHFELLLVNESEFHLKCLSKNGLFINNTYTKASSTSVLPKQCTIRFPSTDLCLSFSSLLNNNNSIIRTPPTGILRHVSTDTSHRHLSLSSSMDTTPPISLQSVPTIKSEQQVILVADNQPMEETVKHENLPPLSINIPKSSSLSSESSFSAGSTSEQGKWQHPSPATNPNSFLGSSCSTSPKTEPHEHHPSMHSPIVQQQALVGNDQNNNSSFRNGTKPPFSYAQLIVQAILSAPDKQMTLSQIYNFISTQYPYYETNSRGWQNSIRHNLSLNRYFIRLARKENESGKGSFWRLDQTCEEKLIDHAFRHRKHRAQSTHIVLHTHIKHESDEPHSPTVHYSNDQGEFLLADIPTSNSSTPLTSPLNGITSPTRHAGSCKRNRHTSVEPEIEALLNCLLDAIQSDRSIKRQKI